MEKVLAEPAALERLQGASQSLAVIGRLTGDADFSRQLGGALEAGDARQVGELLAPMGVQEVSLRQSASGTALTFNLGIVVCVTVTIQICREF